MKRIRHTLLLVTILLGGALTAFGQRIDGFEYLGDPANEESFLGVGLSRSFIANPEAPNPENHQLSAFTFYLDLRKIRLEQGKASLYFSNQLLGDLLLLLQETVKNPNSIYRSEGSSISPGLLGWFNVGWNLTKGGRVQPFLGLHHNDYFIGSTYVHDTIQASGNRATYEPQGYYFAGGPLVGVRAALGSFALMEVRTTYSLSYLRPVSLSYAIRDDSYPKPHFLHVQLECMTRWGLFASLQNHRLLNRGDLPNAIRRWDATLGFRFML